ncbi:MAG: CHASE domain-containing protein [Gemmataceae bacterium]|nr:CHASE domain-containing protein [Gemmataceae bacterium]MCI0742307.1 CHASE domain-containing protein [Gemmataceae bacterium]
MANTFARLSLRLPAPLARALPLVLLAAAGTALTAVTFALARSRDQERVHRNFSEAAGALGTSWQRTVTNHLEALETIQYFYASAQLVEAPEFQTFTSGMFRSLPGLQALYWAPRVKAQEFAAYLNDLKKYDLPPGYEVRDAEGRVRRPPAESTQDIYPLQFVEPFARFRDVWGLDLAVEPDCLSLLESAREEARAVGRNRLRFGREVAASFFVFRPLYKRDPPPKEIYERRRSFLGCIIGQFQVEELMRASLGGRPQDFDVFLWDDAVTPPRLLYSTEKQPTPERLAAGAAESPPASFPLPHGRGSDGYDRLHWPMTLQQHGCQWTLIVLPKPDYLDRQSASQEWWVLVGGLLATAFLVAYVSSVQGRAARIERLVDRRTAELADKNQKLQVTLQELQKAQAQLVQSEKLASLGQLVAGVLHEVNNPLAFVNNNVAVLERDVSGLADLLRLHRDKQLALPERCADFDARIEEAAQRCDAAYTLDNLGGLLCRTREGLKRIGQIVKDLRSFARFQESERKECDLNQGIEATLNLVASQAHNRQVTLSTELTPVPLLTCSPAKLNQVVYNLLINAIDACKPGERVSVRTMHGPRGVELHVHDTGTGIDPTIRAKIFDPFFTTKPVGQGTGLGLSVSYSIVRDHGGDILVESTPGKGSHFTVVLPLR